MTTETVVDYLLYEVASEVYHLHPTVARISAPAVFDERVAQRRGRCTGGALRQALKRLHRMAVNEPDRVRGIFDALRAHHAHPHQDLAKSAEEATSCPR